MKKEAKVLGMKFRKNILLLVAVVVATVVFIPSLLPGRAIAPLLIGLGIATITGIAFLDQIIQGIIIFIAVIFGIKILGMIFGMMKGMMQPPRPRQYY
jgi:hypothetical protein